MRGVAGRRYHLGCAGEAHGSAIFAGLLLMWRLLVYISIPLQERNCLSMSELRFGSLK